MTSTLDTRPGPVERRRTRRFGIQFAIAIVAYVLVLVASLTWGDWSGSSAWKTAWVLAPIVPIIATAVILTRFVSQSDEYEVVMTGKSLSVAFMVTMLAAATAGMLDFAGMPIHGIGWWLYGVGMATWLVARVALAMREGGATR